MERVEERPCVPGNPGIKMTVSRGRLARPWDLPVVVELRNSTCSPIRLDGDHAAINLLLWDPEGKVDGPFRTKRQDVPVESWKHDLPKVGLAGAGDPYNKPMDEYDLPPWIHRAGKVRLQLGYKIVPDHERESGVVLAGWWRTRGLHKLGVELTARFCRRAEGLDECWVEHLKSNVEAVDNW